MNNTITIKAYGKLNLYLDITGVRDDGYHLLKTVMQSVSAYDLLTFELCEGEGIELVCDCDDFPLDCKNLIWKAIEKFYAYTGISPVNRVIIQVQKNIPSMAGMAGGSSDCAAALVAMNELFNTKLSLEQLCEIGVTLGADVPFTLTGGTVLCEGIGEKLTRLSSLPELFFAVVKPDVGISTIEAYRNYDNSLDKNTKAYSNFENALKNKNISAISASIYNALEIAADLEEIHQAKAMLLEFGAENSMMTGSGSAVFGIFFDKSIAQTCINNMQGYSYSGVLTPINIGWEIINKKIMR